MAEGSSGALIGEWKRRGGRRNAKARCMRGPAVLGARFDTNQSVPQGRHVFPDYVITLPLCWGSRQGVVGDGGQRESAIVPGVVLCCGVSTRQPHAGELRISSCSHRHQPPLYSSLGVCERECVPA